MTTTTAPAAVTRYLAAAEAGDARGVAACFTEDGAVTDEGRTYTGREAVGTLRELLDPDAARPPFEVEFRSVPALRVAAVSEGVATAEVDGWWRTALRELYDVLRAAGVRAVGPPGGLYATELFAEESGRATLFVPTAAGVPPSGRVRMTELPAAELAVAVHRGPHESAGRTYGDLGTFVAERLIGVPGPVRENYVVGAAGFTAPLEGGDPALMRTEICWPVFRTAAG